MALNLISTLKGSLLENFFPKGWDLAKFDRLCSRKPAEITRREAWWNRHYQAVPCSLLTDFDMPGLTGYELAGRLRALRPDIKILLTSGMAEDSIAPQCRPHDWPHFIAKPFTTCTLGQKLREVLEGDR